MKFKFTVEVDVPDKNIEAFAKDCDCPVDAYIGGLQESIKEEIEIGLNAYDSIVNINHDVDDLLTNAINEVNRSA